MKQRGFTLIEAVVIICIIMILAAVAVPVFTGKMSTAGITYGVNGVTESRCIEGYKFVIGSDGNARQILNELGKGVRCDTVINEPSMSRP
jgi:hypothetical protein